MKQFVIAVVLTLTVPVVGQEKPVAPELSEVERLKVELLQVRTAYAQALVHYDACKAEIGTVHTALGRLRAKTATEELSAAEATLKAEIDASHPGFTFDVKTGLFAKKPPEKTP
jgi:hypothetical protein